MTTVPESPSSQLLAPQPSRDAAPFARILATRAWVGAAGVSLRYPLRLALVLLCIGLAGCAGNQAATSRYTLPAPESEDPQLYRGSAVRILALEPIRIARYLNSEGIVMQLSDIQVQQAQNHLWAETLSRQLERNLRHYLASALPDTRVLGELPPAAGPDALRVRLEVEDFQGRYDGRAVVSGQWQLRDNRGALVSRRRFSVERTLDADGYPALVRSLAQAWQQVAWELAEDLAEQDR